MEPDYNPSSEEQAIDRLHRIGQLRDVHVHKFFIKGISRFLATWRNLIFYLCTVIHASSGNVAEEWHSRFICIMRFDTCFVVIWLMRPELLKLCCRIL